MTVTTASEKRLAREKSIARKLVSKALKSGYKVSVCDGEDYPVKRSTKLNTICAALASTDCDTLLIRRVSDDSKVGRVLLIWGNGEDVVSDYSDNIEIAALVSATEVSTR